MVPIIGFQPPDERLDMPVLFHFSTLSLLNRCTVLSSLTPDTCPPLHSSICMSSGEVSMQSMVRTDASARLRAEDLQGSTVTTNGKA
jgi:hypothetical protein